MSQLATPIGISKLKDRVFCQNIGDLRNQISEMFELSAVGRNPHFLISLGKIVKIACLPIGVAPNLNKSS